MIEEPFLRRNDGMVSFGYSLMRGKRASMEDFYHAQVSSQLLAYLRFLLSTSVSMHHSI